MRLVLGVLVSIAVIFGIILYMPNDPVDFMGIPMGGKKSDIDNFSDNYREDGYRYILKGMGTRTYSFCKSYEKHNYSSNAIFRDCEEVNYITILEPSDTIEQAMVVREVDIQQLDSNYQGILEKYGRPISDTTEIDEQGWKIRTLKFGKQNKLILSVIVHIYVQDDTPEIAKIRIRADTGEYIRYEHKVEEYYKKTFPTFYQEP